MTDLQILLADGGIGVLVMLALSVALSAAAYFLGGSNRGPKSRAIFTPTTLAAQGSVIPLLIGRRRIGCVLAWAGSRYTRTEGGSSGGGLFGKGSRKPKGGGQTVYYEAGWHLLCVGRGGTMADPGYTTLRRIWQEGKIIWEGDIDAVNDPSGSSFTANDGSEFTIYWGEVDQPVNALLADASRVGWSSRWPSVVYVVWTNKRLGPSPRWPQIEYDLEVRAVTEWADVAFAGITDGIAPYITTADYAGVNPAYALGQVAFESYPQGIGLDHDQFAMLDLISACAYDVIQVSGTPGAAIGMGTSSQGSASFPGTFEHTYNDTYTVPTAGWYELDQVTDRYFQALVRGGGTFDSVRITITSPSGDVAIVVFDEAPGLAASDAAPACWTRTPRPDLDAVQPGWAPHAYFSRDIPREWIYLGETGTWDIAVVFTATNVAINVVYDLAMDYYLLGSPTVAPPTGRFADLAQLMVDEEQVCSVIAAEGEEADATVAKLLQDMGALWTRAHAEAGKNAWYPVRNAAATALPTELLLPTEVETEVLHVERGVDRASFVFADADRSFKDTVVSIDEDAQATLTDNVRARRIELPTVVDFLVASKVAERRSQEELAGGARFTVFAGRDTRTLEPGVALSHPDVPIALRLTDIKIQEDAARVELTLIADHYGAAVAAFEHTQEPSSGGDTDPATDNAEATYIEVPAFLGERGVLSLLPLRVRGDRRMTLQVIHLSPDGSTYTEVSRDVAVQTGGVLASGMTATAAWRLESGPTFTAEGEDVTDAVEDLTADEASWCAGRQLCLIGEEVFHLRNIEAVGGGVYRLRGLQRARYDTVRAAHAIADPVFIFSFDAADPIFDVLLEPGATIRMKQQAVGGGPGAVALGSVTVTTKTLTGKGIVPMKPGGLRPTAPVPGVWGYYTGNDITFRWGYRSTETPNTGAGMQGAGLVTGDSAVQGTFEVRLLTTGDVLKQTISGLTTPEYTLDNADLVSWFTTEQDIKIQVRNVNGGYRSAAIERTCALLT